MPVRALLTALALATVTLTVRAADDENPYKNAKIGDYATYSMVTKIGAMPRPKSGSAIC